MTSRDFVIDKKLSQVRIKSIIQHKLRIVLKCYTITDFLLNDDKTYTFKRNFRIKGIRVEDKNEFSGSYEIEKIDKELVLLKLVVN